jgi:hypothetical protein
MSAWRRQGLMDRGPNEHTLTVATIEQDGFHAPHGTNGLNLGICHVTNVVGEEKTARGL